MPNIWQAVDANFPTLMQGEPIEEQYRKLHSYMFVLTEQLKYSLNNLDATNWNDNALKKERSETTEKVENDVSQVSTEIKDIVEKLQKVSDALSKLDTKENDTGEKVLNLENFAGNMKTFISAVPEQKAITIGKTDQTINFVGTIYVNGRPLT